MIQQDHSVRDLANGLGGTGVFPIGSTRIDTDEGPALSFNGTTNGTFGTVANLPPIDRLAFVARVRSTGAQPGNPGAAFGVYAGSAQGGLGIGFNGNNVGAAWLTSAGAGTAATVPTVQGQWYTVIVQGTPVSIALTSTAVWVDGAPAVRAGTSNGAVNGPLNEVVLGAQHNSSGYLRRFRGDVLWAAILVGDSPNWMTDDLAAELVASGYPYNLQAKSRSIWLPPPTVVEPVSPPLLTSSQALYVPSVGRGPVALSAPLLSSGGVLYAASVGRGPVSVSVPLLANTQTLYAPAVTSVGAPLRPPLLANTSTAYAPEVKRGAVTLAAPLLVNPSQVFAPVVGSGAVPIGVPLLANASVMHAPSVQAGAVALSAPLLVNAGAVYAPSVSAGAVQLMPPLLMNTQIFYAPSVSEGRLPGPATVGAHRQVSMPRLLRTVEMQPLNRRVGP